MNKTASLNSPVFNLLAQMDICAAKLVTWGVGPDVKKTKKQCHLTAGARKKKGKRERRKTKEEKEKYKEKLPPYHLELSLSVMIWVNTIHHIVSV